MNDEVEWSLSQRLFRYSYLVSTLILGRDRAVKRLEEENQTIANQAKAAEEENTSLSLLPPCPHALHNAGWPQRPSTLNPEPEP